MILLITKQHISLFATKAETTHR